METPENTQTLPEGAPAPAETAPPADTYIVDGKEFANEEAYYGYLKSAYTESQIERQVMAGKLEGYQEALANNPATATAPAAAELQQEDDWDQEAYWANPETYMKGYLNTKLEKERQSIKQELQDTMTQQQTDEQVWNEFATRHPHLSAFRNEVTDLATKHSKEIGFLAKKDRGSAYDFIAGKVTERFKNYAAALNPTTDLPNGGAGPSTGGSNTSATKPGNSNSGDKPLDFTQQIRSMRNR